MDPRNQPSLLERIYSWENLLDAYHEAASEKWYRNDVTAFAANLEENLISIQNDLIWHTYKVGRYRQFYVHEPKKRLVMALGFRDRVVQWAIYLQTNQYLDNGMIYHSYGAGWEKEPPEQPTGFNTGARSWIESRANGTT